MAQKNVMAWLHKTILWEKTERERVGERKWNRSSFATIGLQSDRNEIFKKNLNSNLLQLCISQHYAHTHMHSYVCTYRVRNVIHRQHSSRIHTHTHTHRVTNAPTYTNTHTDTFVAVTRATTFVGFLLNNVCGTQIYLNFSRVPHFSSFLMVFIFFLRLVVSFYNGCRRRCDFRLFLSHTLTEPNTHSHRHIWNDPLSQR